MDSMPLFIPFTVMGIKQTVLHFVAGWLIERPARKLTFDQHLAKLTETGQIVTTRMAKAADTPAHRNLARHIIGIERWGQRRLHIALGQPTVHDEYDGYQPAAHLDLKQLQQEFQATRQESLNVIQQFKAKNIDPNRTVPHNDFGEITLRGWLQYFAGHGERESRNFKEKTV